jgi:hypothetical protein
MIASNEYLLCIRYQNECGKRKRPLSEILPAYRANLRPTRPNNENQKHQACNKSATEQNLKKTVM